MSIPENPSFAPRPLYSAPREWTRVHPISPYLGSGPIIGFVAVYSLARFLPSWVAGGSEEYELINRMPLLMLAGAVILIVAAVIGYGLLSWRRNEYRIADDAIYYRKGIVFKQHKQARLDRIEAVDVVQPLLARLFGMAQLNVQVAGGTGSGIDLKFLRLGDAEALRNEVLALAAGAKLPSVPDAVAGSSASQPLEMAPASLRDLGMNIGETHPVTAVQAAPEHGVYRVPPGRLFGSVALSTPTFLVAAGAIALLVAAAIFGSVVGEQLLAMIGTSVFAVVGFVVAVLSYFWNQINEGFNFTAATSSDGLRLRHGLLETRRQTVTPGRVQAVVVTQGVLWRTKGWYKIRMNVAGYQEEQARVSNLLPVGTLDDVLLALRLVLPDVADESLARMVQGRGGEDDFTPSPRRARLLDPFQWNRRGVLAGDRALFIRSGWLTHQLAVVPNERTQSLGVSQGPIQRSRRLADLTVHSTPGPVRPVAGNLDVDDALALLHEQAARARASRGVSHA
ncbi:PH domain-containing protein [Demequina sp.]|uniref:PH domain-containing protein n=1 Tax=Demequina sp. TaxID=2050685 RepID=UPI003D09B821